MKKKYIVPSMDNVTCMFESFIAASEHGGNQNIDEEKKDPIDETEGGEGFEQGSKDHNAWSSWDE